MSTYVFECTVQEKNYLSEHGHFAQVRAVAVPFLTPEQAEEIAGDAEIISPFVHSHITDELLGMLPNLKLIATRSTGYDHIDIAAATARGITVCNVPAYGENTVAEHAFALLLAISRNIVPAVESVRSGQFDNQAFQGFDLAGRTVGVIGAGRIGKHFLRMAHGFGMHLLAYDLYPDTAFAAELGVEYVSLEDLLSRSDIISIHAKATPETHHLLNAQRFAQCKKGMVVINTSRGDLIETAALTTALREGVVQCAGLDVIEYETELQEGVVHDDLRQLLALPNVLVTPHIAFNSAEAVKRIVDTTIGNIEGFLTGTPQNVCTHI